MHKYFFLIIFFALPLFAQQYPRIYSDSGYSKVTIVVDTVDGYESSTKTATTESYHLQYYDTIPVLINEQSVQTISSGAEGEQGFIKLTARISKNGFFDNVIWQDSLDANLVKYNEYDHCEVVAQGCCAASDAKLVLRYRDGNPLLLMTSDLYSVSIPNTHTTRYIGFLDNAYASTFGIDPYTQLNGDTMLCGTITYTDPETLTRQVVVISFKDRNMLDSLGLGIFDSLAFTPTQKIDRENYYMFNHVKDLNLWSRDKNPDPQGISGFTIDIHLAGNESFTVKIPVINDRLDISRLKSEWFTFSLR